jgi:flagellar biosynthetic protein FliR
MPAYFVNWSLIQFQSFMLILMRVSTILFMMPMLNARNLPNLLKVGLALTVSLVLLPVVQVNAHLLPADPYSFGFFMIAELMMGLILGLSLQVIFAGIQMGGEIAGFQMGLSMAHLIDPQSGVDTPVLSQFQYILGLLIFLSIDGHHWFFRALLQSFQLLAPGEIHFGSGLYQHLLHLTGNIFVLAIKLAAPVMVVLILTQVALGILSKAVPQVNILITSFPLTIGLGLLFLGFSIDLFLPYFKALFEETGKGLVSTLLPLMQEK